VAGRHGIYLLNQGAFADVAILVELARAAEAAGWDGFFVW
jgi:alkanesulfonate monooxygenase SsuD/methylene tetrahydromethanopterin reductase-like flavin-dependent oxidoreductase (luciferase family)